MEDFVTWVDTSKLKRTVMRYNDEVRLILNHFMAQNTKNSFSSTISICCRRHIPHYSTITALQASASRAPTLHSPRDDTPHEDCSSLNPRPEAGLALQQAYFNSVKSTPCTAFCILILLLSCCIILSLHIHSFIRLNLKRRLVSCCSISVDRVSRYIR